MTGGLGHVVLEITVTHRLGDAADSYDVPAIVEGVIERYGFVDLDEIPPGGFDSLASEHRVN